jgi:hypothetical protein
LGTGGSFHAKAVEALVSQVQRYLVCHRRGEQIPLAKGKANKAEAERAFFKLMVGDTLAQPARPQDTCVVAILDLFLDHSQRW